MFANKFFHSFIHSFIQIIEVAEWRRGKPDRHLFDYNHSDDQLQYGWEKIGYQTRREGREIFGLMLVSLHSYE